MMSPTAEHRRTDAIFTRMRIPWLAQLGFDFGDVGNASSAVESPPASAAVSHHAPPTVATAVPRSTRGTPGADTVPMFAAGVSPTLAPRADVARGALAPSRGRAATRAQTAVLFSRLQELGLRGVDGLVLMRTRTVMVSLIGRTLRVHEGYTDAPESVLRAVVAFAMARTRASRAVARDAILAHEVERAPAARRIEAPRPGDLAIIAQLTSSHQDLNARWFDGGLSTLPIRLSGRMASRLGHFDPGSRLTPPEIVLSRKHVVRHGWRETMHTLLHEMVHQWQHETGQPVDHGREFRRKCRDVGIAPAARRDVMPLARLRRA